MKSVYLIAPAISLLIAGGLVGAKWRAISQLENKSELLKKQIAAVRDGIDRRQAHTALARPTKHGVEDHDIDWAVVVRMFSDGGIGKERMLMSLQGRLREMNKDQLRVVLDQIQSLDLSHEEQSYLHLLLIEPLEEKDPGLLLSRFAARFRDHEMLEKGMLSYFPRALDTWLKNDKTAAIAWFDKEIAAGTFENKSLDGKSEIRLVFEASVMTQLISTEPAAACARISALPADQRLRALMGSNDLAIEESGQAAYADLVRTHLSGNDRYAVFGHQTTKIMSRGGLEKLRAYLDRIGATGEERIRIVEGISDPEKRAEALENLQ